MKIGFKSITLVVCALCPWFNFHSAYAFSATTEDEDRPFRGSSLAIYEPINESISSAALPIEVERRIPVATWPSTPLAVAAEAPATDTQSPPPEAAVARGNLAVVEAKPLTDKLATNLAITAGVILASAALDRPGDRFAVNHGTSGPAKAIKGFGNALPFIAIGAAGLAFLDDSDPRRQRTALAALEAGGLATASSLGIKYAVGRARPEAELGPSSFHDSSIKRGKSSFPSMHSATVWGIATPFAKEYDAPWLYGLAASTNLARVIDRKHWVSDTVAGSLLGYWIGDLAWHYHRDESDRKGPRVSLGDRAVLAHWTFQ